jgi:glycosyltransferase involved in cell wall biosynthesis
MLDVERVPLVVIATPVYNGAQFLQDTMECVQAQTYPNLVHCVLDNASTDATPEIIARFGDGRVPLITASNAVTLPQIDNWNAALELVPREAAYFRVLAADDMIVPDCIEKMVALGERNPHAGIIGCHEWVNTTLHGTNLPPDRSVFDGRALVRGSLLRVIDFPYMHCLYRCPPGGIPKKFYDTESNGKKLLCSDVDAAMRVLSQSCCAYVHEPLTMTRWPGNVTATELIPNRVDLWSMMQLVERWGPVVFDTTDEYLKCRDRYLRYYYLHLLLWITQRQSEVVKQHQIWLHGISLQPTILDYVQALMEWPFLRTAHWFRQMASRLGLPTHFYQLD